MGRLIEVQDVDGLPSEVTLRVGDALWFAASGGRVRGGGTTEAATSDAVQMLGPFQQGVMGPAGQLLTPAGPPNAVLFLARAPGRAEIEIVTGDPWRGSSKTMLHVTVEP